MYADVECGVAQGLILGPLLFMLDIGDICNISNSFKFIMFANDTNIASGHNIIDVLYSQANKELTNLCNWFCLNKLSLNVDKANYTYFSNKQDDPKIQ